MNEINYVLPNRDFFDIQESGQVSHALGCIEGYLENRKIKKINVYGHGINNIGFLQNKKISVFDFESVNSNTKDKIICNLLNTSSKRKLVHVRAGKYFYSFLLKNPMLLFKINIVVIEINGLGIKSRLKFLSILFSFLKDYLIANILPVNSIIYVVNDNLKARLDKLQIKKRKIITVPNGSPNNLIVNDNNITEKQKKEVIFIGVFQTYNDYRFVESCLNSGIDVSMYGYGRCENKLKNYEERYEYKLLKGVKNVQEIAINHDFSKMIYGIVPINEQSNSKYLSPIKLYTYVSLGFPVLISKKSLGKNIDDLINKPFLIVYEEISEISEIINNITEDKYLKLSKSAHEFSIENSWGSRMKKLLDEII